MWWYRLREWINLAIYDYKDTIVSITQKLSLFVALSAVGVIIYYYGVEHGPTEKTYIFYYFQLVYAFYVIRYLIQLVFQKDAWEHIRSNKFQSFLILYLIIEGFTYHTYNNLLAYEFFHWVNVDYGKDLMIHILLQFFLMLIIAMEWFTKSNYLPKFKVNPAHIFIYTFLLLIGIGTLLLLLPEMTRTPGSLSFLDALFTATSATCVTGLSVVDTATFFSGKGQFVIMLLIKLGGLNIISYGSFAVLFSKMGVGAKQSSILEDFLFTESPFSSKSYLIKILVFSITIEIIGALVIGALMLNQFPDKSFIEISFFSIFHSISAFNNAGFSNIEGGFLNPDFQGFYLLHLVVSFLIILGAMGFMVLFDMFGIKSLRDRLANPWKKPLFSTRLEIRATLILLVLGGISFFFLEKENSLNQFSEMAKIITSFFQSVTLRTAGFSTVDFGELSIPFLLIALILMFIGGSSGSTAGGIKTSTITVLFLSAYNNLRGKKDVEVLNRSIPKSTIHRASSVFLFAIGYIVFFIFLLSISEKEILNHPDFGIMDLIFEEVSAFSTVGISTGITGILSSWGKFLIILSMFIGRIGTITIGIALLESYKRDNSTFPEGKILIG